MTWFKSPWFASRWFASRWFGVRTPAVLFPAWRCAGGSTTSRMLSANVSLSLATAHLTAPVASARCVAQTADGAVFSTVTGALAPCQP